MKPVALVARLTNRLLRVQNYKKFRLNGLMNVYPLTCKAPITTAADDIYKNFFIVFQKK